MITWEGGEEPVRLMLKEGMRHKWRLVLGFVLICSLGVALGLWWPKTYASAVTVSLDQDNIIDALMEGRAVRVEVAGPPQNAEDMALDRPLLARALEESGRIDDSTPLAERNRLIAELSGRTDITQPGEGLVAIHYRGSDPDATQRMAQRLGELFIDETLKGRERASNAAYEFIDQQVHQYEKTLTDLRRRIEDLRSEHPVAKPGAAQRLSQRELTLTQQIADLGQQIKEARIRQQSLKGRLAQAPAPIFGVGGGGPQGPSRLAQLRTDLATLRLRYTDSHPDVVALRREIAQIEQHGMAQGGSGAAVAPGSSGSESAVAAAGAGDSAGQAQNAPAGVPPQIAMLGGTLHQQLQSDIYATRTQIEQLQSRMESVHSQLADVREEQTALDQVQTQVADLERDYEVNRNIYQDLLARRENARVSRDLGSAQRGLTMRIAEPARLPTTAELPHPLHFALAGGVLGAGLPIGLLFLVVMFDPRIRDVAHVPIETSSVLLTTIPHARTRAERRLAPLSAFACVVVVIATVVALAALMWMQTTHGL